MAVGDIYQVTLRWTQSGQRLLTVIHFRVTADVGGADVDKEQALADYIADTTNPANPLAQVLTVISNNVLCERVDAQVIYPDRLSYRSRDVGQFGGAGVGEGSPVCAVITKRTDEAGRRQLGSIHMPGVPQEAVEDSVLTPEYKADVLDAWTEWLDPITVGGVTWEMCIWHGPLASPVYNYVTNLLVQPEIRVMQRRVVGRGI